MLGQPVQPRVVNLLPHEPLVTPPDAHVIVVGGTLSNLALGCDFVLGGDYLETLPALEVSVGGLNIAQLEVYLSGTWSVKALALLCNYFIASEMDVLVRYEKLRFG
jgi:predicted component of type VI protein secretion system